MAVVSAFGILNGTQNAGMTAYYRAPDCDAVTIADMLPILSKINYYEDEYIIGEILIWDDPDYYKIAPNVSCMVRVIIYNDGWILAWFDKESQSQGTTGGCTYVNSTTLAGFGTFCEYMNKWNTCVMTIESSVPTDPDCPDGSTFTINATNSTNGQIRVHEEIGEHHFNSGYTYTARVEMSSGNLVWWDHTTTSGSNPPLNSNRLYRAIYEIWKMIRFSSNTSNYTLSNASLVYMYDYTLNTYTNETTDFNDDGADDCQVLPSVEVINDAFYIGYTYKYCGIDITMGVLGIGSGVIWEYWNGTIWTALNCVDNTSGFISTGNVTFDPPDDWGKIVVVASDYYWVRARVTTAAYTTTPLLTQGQLRVVNNIDYTDNELGMYSFEDTGALYCLICGISGGGVWYGTKMYNFTTTVLPGKIIYKHKMNSCYRTYCKSYERFGWCRFTVNGYTIFYNSRYGQVSITETGFRVYDISDISVPALQNIYEFSAYGYTAGSPYPDIYYNIGSVLITS